MPTHAGASSTAGTLQAGPILFVTDPVRDNSDVLEFACALAQRHGARLELVHVVEPGHILSMPDGQMGIQYRLEALARSLRSLNRFAQAVLLFGKPGHVLRERAEELDATLIAIALNGSATDIVQKKLAADLAGKCACPVLTLPPDIRIGGPRSFSFPGQTARRLVS